jgi:hypothetical protein
MLFIGISSPATHDRFRKNPRMAQTCFTYGKFSDEEKGSIAKQAKGFLDGMKSGAY